MISDKYKCVFIHIPKTAGQSIEHFFLDVHDLTWKERSPLLLRYNADPNMGPERLAHLTAEEYVEHGYMAHDLFASYFSFSFVRNPWARLLSEYKYKHYHTEYTFKEFVTIFFPKKDRYSDEYRHVMPQYEFLHDSNGELVVDFVGRFEKLQSDFDFVCSKLGISSSLLPYVNSSVKKEGVINKIHKLFSKKPLSPQHYTSYYDDELRDIVGEKYHLDISTFGYEFGQ